MKRILIGLLALIAVVALVGLFLPTSYSIERRITINAPPASVHALVGDLERWPEWTPWITADPTVVTTLGDKKTGVGASQTWTSDDGGGELTFTACDAETGIAYDMVFIMKDNRAPARAKMLYTREGDATVVTWIMEGDVADMAPPVLAGYARLFLPGQVGDMFDQGLLVLKEKVEAEG